MAAPILWAPGKIAFFLQAHYIPCFRGGGGFFFGGEVPILFLWARGFSETWGGLNYLGKMIGKTHMIA